MLRLHAADLSATIREGRSPFFWSREDVADVSNALAGGRASISKSMAAVRSADHALACVKVDINVWHTRVAPPCLLRVPDACPVR
eukprot:700826-Prymnesium_polylepis.1